MKHKPSGYEKEQNGKYKEYLVNAITKMVSDGYRLPELKTTATPSKSFQFRGPEHIWNSLQGYWERNKKVYEFRARVECRATYLGTIVLLMEEELLKNTDNSKRISALEIRITEKKDQHERLNEMATLRKEIIAMLQEIDGRVLTQEKFNLDVTDLINTFSSESDKEYFSKVIDEMIMEEVPKLKNRKYQQKHRQFEMLSKGISLVDEG